MLRIDLDASQKLNWNVSGEKQFVIDDVDLERDHWASQEAAPKAFGLSAKWLNGLLVAGMLLIGGTTLYAIHRSYEAGQQAQTVRLAAPPLTNHAPTWIQTRPDDVRINNPDASPKCLPEPIDSDTPDSWVWGR